MQTEFKAYIQEVQKQDHESNVQRTRIVLEITGPHDRAVINEMMLMSQTINVRLGAINVPSTEVQNHLWPNPANKTQTEPNQH